ncbi:MAG: radical SAM protein, partial [Peptoniphilus harei]|nr:radical SAM protein [Peptoniphilus harei]
ETTNRENLEEQIFLLENLTSPDETLYSSGHMVNMINVTGYMSDKDKMIDKIKYALETIDPKVLDMTNQKIAR